MFSDIHSVRSDPTGPRHHKKVMANSPDIYFDSEQNSNSQSADSNSQRWKNLLLPEIGEKYTEIMRQRQGVCRRIQIDNQRSGLSGVSRPSKVILSNSRMKDFQNVQKFYEDKIDSLELQNDNLRQQLFYLREALLINFETKNKTKEKERQNQSLIG